MYAVVQTGGKQYRVSKGDIITVEKLSAEAGANITLDEVLVVGGDETIVGKPFVEGACVEGTVVENGKGKKVIIYKYKAKKDYSKKQGHRQPYTKIEIKDILLGGKTASKEEAPAEAPKAAEGVSLKSMKKAELIEFAQSKGIELNPRATNAEMIAVIEEALK